MKDTTEKPGDKRNAFLKESILLSCSTVGRTTSSSYAEKAVAWQENRLSETKTKLDEKLYKSLVKLNSNKLEIVDELTRLQKSRSTGNLEALDKLRPSYNRCMSARQRDQPVAKSLPQSGRIGRRNSSDIGILSSSVKSNPSPDKSTCNPKCTNCPEAPSDSVKSSGEITKVAGAKRQSSPDELKDETKPDGRSKVAFKLGTESSSEDSGDEENKLNQSQTRTISVVSCSIGRECGSARSELQKFENASRRYNNQVLRKSTSKTNK